MKKIDYSEVISDVAFEFVQKLAKEIRRRTFLS